jgi:hypothetical protein
MFASLPLLLLLSLPIVFPAGAQDAPDPAGNWEGAIITPNGDLGINVDLMEEDDVWSGDISIPAQGAQDLALVDVVVDGAKVGFKIPNVPGDPTFDGTLSDDGNVISGSYSQGGAVLEFKLTRTQGGG